MNAVTAKTPEGARIALTVDTDRQAHQPAHPFPVALPDRNCHFPPVATVGK